MFNLVLTDLHCGNIFLRLPIDIRQALEPSQLYQRFGNPILAPVIRLDRKPLSAGVPTHVVGPARLGIRSDQITSIYLPIMLSDFGSSYYPSRIKRTNAHTLPYLVPPEIFFLNEQKDKYPLSFSSDIWTLACTIFEIIGSWGPFDTFGGTDILEDQVNVLGKLPDQWWSQWESRGDFFNEDATIDVQSGALIQDSLEKRYDDLVNAARRRSDMEEQGQDEKRAFLQMIGSMLQYLPGDRATIQDVIESEWMQKWAFPAKARLDLDSLRR